MTASAPARSPRRGYVAAAGLVAAALAAAAVIAVLVPRGVGVAAPVAAALLFTGLVSRSPGGVFGGSLLALAYAPESFTSSLDVLARPELQKGLLLVAMLPMVLARGIRLRFALPIAAYVLLALLSVLAGDLNARLTPTQMVSTFVTLTLGWLALTIRWNWERDAWLLKVLSLVAITSVGLGVVLQLAGLHDLVSSASSFDSTRRLRGASIAPSLAMSALVSAAAGYAAHRLLRWRPAPFVVLINVAILLGTVSRGAALALLIAALWPALRLVAAPLAKRPELTLLRGAVLLLVSIAAVAYALPTFEARNSGGRYVQGQGTTDDPTSGRTEAWQEFYDIAQQSPWFGHGLGSGPLTEISQEGFLAQHNEYLRFFLEGGYVGGGIVLLSIIVVVAMAISRAPPGVRLDLTGLAIAFAALSGLENTLTTPSILLPFGLILALVHSAGRAGARPRHA